MGVHFIERWMEKRRRMDIKEWMKKIKEKRMDVGPCQNLAVGSWFEGFFTVDVSELEPNRPNTMNLVEKRAQELGLCEDFVNGQAGSLGNRIVNGVV